MNLNEQQPIDNFTADRIPSTCRDCGAVIPPGGAVVLGESGHIICRKCLDLVLNGATAEPARKEAVE